MADNTDSPIPHKWFIAVNQDNKYAIHDWKVMQEFDKSLIDNPEFKYISENGGAYETLSDVLANRDRVEITFEQFKKYVLMIPDLMPSTEENCDYLIEMFDRLNIQ